MSIWNHLIGFRVEEKWGDPLMVNGLLLLLLSTIRLEFRKVDPNCVFVIHCAYERTGHAPSGQHPKGNAVDFHILSLILNFKEQAELLQGILGDLQVSHVCGYGIYPTWNHPGFHVDVRGERGTWGRIGEKYVGWNEALTFWEQRHLL